jgi:hypothetical protein
MIAKASCPCDVPHLRVKHEIPAGTRDANLTDIHAFMFTGTSAMTGICLREVRANREKLDAEHARQDEPRQAEISLALAYQKTEG